MPTQNDELISAVPDLARNGTSDLIDNFTQQVDNE